MTPPESSDDRMLREWLARKTPPALPDAGFTRRVMAALPPSRPKRDWRAIAATAAAAAIGLAWALANGAQVSTLVDALGNPYLAFGLAIAAAILVLADEVVEAAPSPLP